MLMIWAICTVPNSLNNGMTVAAIDVIGEGGRNDANWQRDHEQEQAREDRQPARRGPMGVVGTVSPRPTEG